ncbi:MAG: glycosyltransferase [Bacteroidota bacterium]
MLLFRRANSLVVIQKIYTNRYYANLLKLLVWLRNENTVYDLDDAEYYRWPAQTLVFFIKHCQYIQVGSESLRAYCLKYNPNVFLATSPVIVHKQYKTHKGTKPVLGWVGDFGNGRKVTQAFSHKTNLYQLFFSKLASIRYPIKLVLIGVKNESDIPELKDLFANYPHIELEIPTNLNWRDDRWLYTKIVEFDIGLSPLVSHPFNEAKSAFKAKQYLSCGVPVVASDVGENNKFITHGVNGYLCNSADEFIKAIDQIVKMDPPSYAELVAHALETEGKFSLDRYCGALIEKLLVA